MNYLDIVNNVLRRMRENEVSSLFQTTQSTVIAALVNDAKRLCEDAHDWSSFYTDLTVGTVTGTQEYSLTGTQNRATIIDVRNVTASSFLTEKSSRFMREQSLVEQSNARPTYYALDGTDANNDDLINFWPIPDDGYTMKVHVSLRPGDLAAEGDNLTIPHQPVIHYAHAMAAQERGDVAGADMQVLQGIAKRSLGDAIMYDAAKNRDRLVWYPV